MHEELERMTADQDDNIHVFPSFLLPLGGTLLIIGGVITAMPNSVGPILIVAGLAAVAYRFTFRKEAKEEYTFVAEDNSDYEMPDELREMPEFAPIGGYRRMSKEPVRKPARPKLTIVNE